MKTRRKEIADNGGNCDIKEDMGITRSVFAPQPRLSPTMPTEGLE